MSRICQFCSKSFERVRGVTGLKMCSKVCALQQQRMQKKTWESCNNAIVRRHAAVFYFRHKLDSTLSNYRRNKDTAARRWIYENPTTPLQRKRRTSGSSTVVSRPSQTQPGTVLSAVHQLRKRMHVIHFKRRSHLRTHPTHALSLSECNDPVLNTLYINGFTTGGSSR